MESLGSLLEKRIKKGNLVEKFMLSMKMGKGFMGYFRIMKEKMEG